MTFNSISGIVRNEANQEVANVTVALIKQSGGSIVEYTTTDSNGFYEFTSHAEADATEENWHVVVYDQDPPIFNSFSKPYVSAALNLGIGAVQPVFTSGGSVPFTNFGAYQADFTGSGIVTESSPQNFVTPVAYSNLVAWYPFDSAFYGGNNADDATAFQGGSGDDTSYDGIVNGANYDSNGGVADINAGSNSGAFSFNGTSDFVDLGTVSGAQFTGNDSFTVTIWGLTEGQNVEYPMLISPEDDPTTNDIWNFLNRQQVGSGWSGVMNFRISTGFDFEDLNDMSMPLNTWVHFAFGYDAQSNQAFEYSNGIERDRVSLSFNPQSYPGEWTIGAGTEQEYHHFGLIDDVRIYNKALSSSEIDQIYQNTQP